MSFCFYPRHEYACPKVSCCPHLGGAALGTLVEQADLGDDYVRMLRGQLNAERKTTARLLEQNESLQEQVAQLQRELRAERQAKFTKVQSSSQEVEAAAPTTGQAPARKRGVPVGHPGWFRPTPRIFDRTIKVPAPKRCPYCRGPVRELSGAPSLDHVQEDVLEGRKQAVLYRHAAARCSKCRKVAQQPGPGELLGSKVGPQARAMATFLHYAIGISARKVPRVMQGLLGFAFTPAALLGFETPMARQAEPLAGDIAKKIQSHTGATHADETYWSENGKRAYVWTHTTEMHVHFEYDRSRAGHVSRNILGNDYSGILVTDCYSGYEAQVARAKQKCLAHLARRARDWQAVVPTQTQAWKFFESVKTWVKRGCAFHRQRKEFSAAKVATQIQWLRDELKRLQVCAIDHEKARTLQGRIRKHHDEWLVFIDHPDVPPTNNLAERTLRPLVILRKLTFGQRSSTGGRRMALLMTVIETGRRHGREVVELLQRLILHSAGRVLRYLYNGPGQ